MSGPEGMRFVAMGSLIVEPTAQPPASGPQPYQPAAASAPSAPAPAFDPRRAVRPLPAAAPAPQPHLRPQAGYPGQPHPHAPQHAPQYVQAPTHYPPAPILAAPAPMHPASQAQMPPMAAPAPAPVMAQGQAQPWTPHGAPVMAEMAMPSAHALPSVEAASGGWLARFKRAPKADATVEMTPQAAGTAPNGSSSRTPFLMGLLAGMVLMFGVGKVLGGGEPEPARMAPEPYAAQAATPATDTFLDQVQAADGSAP